MELLGEQLRKAREAKNLSPQEIAIAIKINIKFIEAIENDQYDALPLPPVYIKGFIRSYCRQVGLDEKELLKLYKDVPTVTKKAEELYIKEELRRPADRKKVLILLLLITGLLGGLLYLFLVSCPFMVKPIAENQTLKKSKIAFPTPKVTAPPKESVLTEKPLPQSGIQELPKEEVPKDNILSEVQVSPALPIPLKMEVEGQLNTWVEVMIDNNPAVEMMLYQGKVAAWEAKEKIEIKIGNAGGIKINVNDIPLKPFGKIGEVVRLVFQGTIFSLNGGEPQNLETWQEKAETQPTNG